MRDRKTASTSSFLIAGLVLALLLGGCATPPSGKEWVHETRSHDDMERHLSSCKANTVLLWPFDWASRCMRRRGYVLRDEGEGYTPPSSPASASPADKLIELQDLRDRGVITDEEYESKRRKYVKEL